MVYTPREPEKKEIALQTRAGKDIVNSQLFEISSIEIALLGDIERDYPFVIFRATPDPVYNCHGLTFASRRTGIDRSDMVHKILSEDGYKKIDNIDDVLPGDIVIYYGENGDIEHSGIVVTKPVGIIKRPWIVSKWGDYKEAIHYIDDCPYDGRNVEYYRVRDNVN